MIIIYAYRHASSLPAVVVVTDLLDYKLGLMGDLLLTIIPIKWSFSL